MFTLMLLFALKVTSPGEMACVGSIRDLEAPMDLYIAGVEQEGRLTFASQGQIIYLNGPGVAHLKTGMVRRVVRPEGKVHDPSTGAKLGIYYVDIGTIRIDAVRQDSAAASVLLSCQGMLKGDLVIPDTPRPTLEFGGDLSSDLTQLPQDGPIGSILLGKHDARELAAGQFCFIDMGSHDGVKAGDRFTIFRPYPAFNAQDMTTAGTTADRTYSGMGTYAYQRKVNGLLRQRALPPQILGDVVVVESGDSVSSGKIINSLSEIHPGDFVVKR